MLIKKSRGEIQRQMCLMDVSVGKDTGHSACRLHSTLFSQVLVLLWVCVFNGF